MPVAAVYHHDPMSKPKQRRPPRGHQESRQQPGHVLRTSLKTGSCGRHGSVASSDSRRRGRSRSSAGALHAASRASRRRLTWTSMVRSSMKTWSPQTRSSSCEPAVHALRDGSSGSAAGGTRWVRPWLRASVAVHRARHAVRARVQQQAGRPRRRSSNACWRLATQHGADAGQQLVGREGLGDVVVGTRCRGQPILSPSSARAVNMMIGSSFVRGSALPAIGATAPRPLWPGSIQSSTTRSGSTRSTSVLRRRSRVGSHASRQSRHGAG